MLAMQAVVEHGGVGQSSQVCLQTWATMEGEVYLVAEVGAARKLGWARECARGVAGVLVAREVAGVMAGKMKNEGLDHNTMSSLTCNMCASTTSSIQLVKALCSPRCSGGLHMKTAVDWAGVRAAAVCKVSQASILALSSCLVPSKGTGWPFGR